MASAGKDFLAALVRSEDTQEYIKAGKFSGMLKPNEVPLFDFIESHINKYGVLPSLDTIWEDLGVKLPALKEPPQFYHDRLKNRHIEARIKRSVAEVRNLLEPGEKKPLEAMAALTEAVYDMVSEQQAASILDFRDAEDVLLKLYAAKNLTEEEVFGLSYGFPTLDGMSGGAKGGDLLSIVGRPSMGKTFLLLFIALHIWNKTKRPAVFFSMEMPPEEIFERMAAMQTKVGLTGITKAFLDSQQKVKYKKGLKSLADAKNGFYVVDGNLSSTGQDVLMLSRQLKARAAFIDGAYLLRHPNPNISRTQRIKENCAFLKQEVATGLNIPTFASWQFNRGGSMKKLKGEKPGLEDIADADDIGQLSSLVLGLLEEDNIETLKYRTVSILKGRQGERGQFKISWDFMQMNFEEVESTIKKMQYVE
jgi:replicative DNA helicase